MATKRTTPTRKASRGKARAAKRPARPKVKAGTKKAVAKRPVKKSAPKKRVTASRPATTRAVAPLIGPVSLEEAQALARASAPPATARGLAPEPGPEPIGKARKRVAIAQQAEHARRTDEYKKVMAILEKRGVRGLAPAEDAAMEPVARAATVAGGAPLRIFAEGDSWFDYPPHVLKGGIIPRLQKKLGVPILNLAKAGDEVRYMLGVKERKLLAKHLEDGCPSGGKWEVLLFSGGGNDIVDNPMALWIKPYKAGETAAWHIHETRFQTALDLVRAGYEDLITLRDELSPGTHLVFHGYDYAIPDGRGVCFLGPWLQPTFKLRGFPEGPIRSEVVKAMLGRFFAMLEQLADPAKGITAIKTQGTLVPVRDSWHNELHPSNDGYDLFVGLFRAKLKELFPGRVL